MKAKTFCVVCSVALVFFLTTSISFAKELWPKKDGELCFDAYQVPYDPQHPPLIPPDGLVRMFVSKIGTNNYIVSGSNTESSSVQLFAGNAILFSNEIIIHTSSSAYDIDEVRGWLGTIKFNRADLEGPFQGVGINYDKNDLEGSIKYDGEQSLYYTLCP